MSHSSLLAASADLQRTQTMVPRDPLGTLVCMCSLTFAFDVMMFWLTIYYFCLDFIYPRRFVLSGGVSQPSVDGCSFLGFVRSMWGTDSPHTHYSLVDFDPSVSLGAPSSIFLSLSRSSSVVSSHAGALGTTSLLPYLCFRGAFGAFLVAAHRFSPSWVYRRAYSSLRSWNTG